MTWAIVFEQALSGYATELFRRSGIEMRTETPIIGIKPVEESEAGESGILRLTVKAGENKLQRTGHSGPAAIGGVVESGSIKRGHMAETNITHDTSSGKYFVYQDSHQY